MNSYNLRNQNVHIVKSISYHIKSSSAGKSNCSCNGSKPVICKYSNKSLYKIINDRQVVNPIRESVAVNYCTQAHKRSFNVRQTWMTQMILAISL